MICTHCKKEVQDTGKFYPIGGVSITVAKPYLPPIRQKVEGLCQGCQENLLDEVLKVIEFYQKEKAAR